MKLEHAKVKITWQVVYSAFKQMNPLFLYKNPVIFMNFLAALLTTFCFLIPLFKGIFLPFEFFITLLIWLILFLCNFANSLAISKSHTQSYFLRQAKEDRIARVERNGLEEKVLASELKKNDIVLCEVGDIIPADGEVIEGVASVDESAITGESAPVIRESGGDRTAVTAGTKVLSDRLRIRVIHDAGKSFLDQMIDSIEGIHIQKSTNELALNIVLSGFTLIFLIATVSLKLFSSYIETQLGIPTYETTVPMLTALFVSLIPTNISAFLKVIRLSSLDQLADINVVTKSIRAIEEAGDVNLLILDKTGTITIGNRKAFAFIPITGVSEKELAKIAQLASLADETPEGRSIVVLAKTDFGMRAETLAGKDTVFIPFSDQTRMSGVDFKNEKGQVIRRIRKGASDTIKNFVENLGGKYPEAIKMIAESIANQGGTPLLVSDNEKIVGVVFLKDHIKGGIKERFLQMRKMGISTLMITGDNQVAASYIAAEVGVDDYIAEATAEKKMAISPLPSIYKIFK